MMLTMFCLIASTLGQSPANVNMEELPLWPDSPPYQSAEDSFQPYLKPFLLQTSAPRGAVLVFPGGGYAGRAAHEADPIAERINAAGLHAFVVHYRVNPHRHPAPLTDAARAVRIVRKHAAEWGIAPDRIAVLGFSAGGHLAASLGVHYDDAEPGVDDEYASVSPRPDALVLCYAVLSSGKYGHGGSMQNLLGPDASADMLAYMSLENQVTENTPPAFLWSTADDQSVPVQNSLDFAAALRENNVPFEMHVYPHGRHGLGLSEDDPHIASWMELCTEWLKGTVAMPWANATSSTAYEHITTEAGGHVDFVFTDSAGFEQCHASTIVEAADGTLFCAFFAGTEESNPDVGVWLSRFAEGQWSAPKRVAKVAQLAHWNPVLFRDAQDVLHLFFKVGVDVPHWSTWWMQSSDNGSTWTSPVELVPGDVGGRGPVKNPPIILSDGSWLAPASVESEVEGEEVWLSFADRSEDGGQTWTRSSAFPLGDADDPRMGGIGSIQPTFWESEPGHVHALVRTGAGWVWQTDSADYGRTWSAMRATDLPNNNSGICALKLDNGRVLLVYNPVGENWGARTPLDLAVTRDNGATWQTIAHLEDDPDQESEYSYPTIVRTDTGVAISYTWNRKRVRAWQIPLDALAE